MINNWGGGRVLNVYLDLGIHLSRIGQKKNLLDVNDV